MSEDKRAEIVEAMARELLGRVNAPEQEIYRVAGDLADIALKAAAEAVAPPGVWTEEERDGLLRTFNEASKHRGTYETLFAVAAYILRRRSAAILALTSEGMKS